jgi:hypothetical protein
MKISEANNKHGMSANEVLASVVQPSVFKS